MFVSTMDVPVRSAVDLLNITLFGSPSVAWLGRPLAMTRRQTRALFYRIAASTRPVPREQLCFLLWPDLGEGAARRQLTVLLNQLRGMLPDPNMLISIDDCIALDHGVYMSDITMFADALAAGQRERDADSLVAAIDLYEGPFLHGFSLPSSVEFEEWVAQERRVWERRYLGALATLIDIWVEAGATEAAIDAAQRYLATDPLAEDMHCRLIELYAATGDRASAVRQFKQCAAVLERELDISPMPRTVALYEMARYGHRSRMAHLGGVRVEARLAA